jgi:hypothetical protein
MATLDVTKKLEIYHTLYRLNRSFAAIVTHCQTLDAIRFFPSKSLRNFQGIHAGVASGNKSGVIGNPAWHRTGRLEPLWQSAAGAGKGTSRSG